MQGNDYELTNKHVEIYNGFTKFVLYGTVTVIAILSLMAIFLV